MTRREQVLKILIELPEQEKIKAINELTLHVKARLRFRSFNDRTKTGAHSDFNLGMDPIQYYVGECFKKLYETNGWDWKFEERSLSEQLKRIANKLISDKVKYYRKRKNQIKSIVDADISELSVYTESLTDFEYDEEQLHKIKEYAIDVSKNDDYLFYFTVGYFDGMEYDEIAKTLEINIKDVYVLRRKLVRKLMKFKNEFYEN